MQLNQHNRFIRTILRVIDVMVMFSAGGQVHWDRDPYMPADKSQRRMGWFIMMCVPIMTFLFFTDPLRSFLDDGQRSVLWLYAGFIGFAAAGIFSLFVIGPKIPLYISVPVAILAWIFCVWFFNFHPQKAVR